MSREGLQRGKTSEQNSQEPRHDGGKERQGENKAFYILNIFCLHFRETKKETHHKNTHDVLPQNFFPFKDYLSGKKKHLFPLVSACFYSANTFITSVEEHVNKILQG